MVTEAQRRIEDIDRLAAGIEPSEAPPTPLLLRVAITAGIVLTLIGLAVLIWTSRY